MPEKRSAACPFCGNDLIVDRIVDGAVGGIGDVRQGGGEPGRRSFCAGSLGCHAWWNPATLMPVARPRPAQP